MVAMNTATQEEQQVAQFVAKKCRQFLTNITRYERDHTGQYRWGYQGDRHFIRLNDEYETFWNMGLSEDQPFSLTINGRLIGTVTIWNPYAYPSHFMIINFAEDMKYRPEVIIRFAQYAGMDTRNFDKSLLEVHHGKVVEEDLVY